MTEHPRRPDPAVADLVDQTGTIALEHVLALLTRLEASPDADEPAVARCREELRRLLSDVASLRNATSLLSQQLERQQDDRQDGRQDGQPGRRQDLDQAG